MIVIVAGAVAVLVAVGLYQIMSGQALRVAIGFLLFSNAINLAIVSSSGLSGPLIHAPLLREGLSLDRYSDPLPQAFILTAIVISLGALGFILALARRLAEQNFSSLDSAREQKQE